jgi:hypothetical protein
MRAVNWRFEPADQISACLLLPRAAVINYWGSCLGARIIPASRMGARFDRVTAALERHLDREPDPALRRGMHYPTSWDPFFTGYMTLYDLYRYPTRHFDFHSRQPTLHDQDPG